MEFTHPLFHRETDFRLSLRSHHSGMRKNQRNNQSRESQIKEEEEKKPMTIKKPKEKGKTLPVPLSGEKNASK